MTSELPSNFCPYKGLQPYTEADRAFFFGRERDEEIIASNLYAAPLTVLYGASGVGKSSVLLAGVVPQLRDSPRVAVVVFRTWQDETFLTALKSEVVRVVSAGAQKDIKVDFTLPFDELLLQCARTLRGPVLFIFDQFEEYFLYHAPSAGAEGFDAEFARAVNRQEVDANFLISMREDSLDKLDRFKGRIPNLLSNMLRLEHLDAEAASHAIRKPLDEYNRHLPAGQPAMRVEDSLVEAVIAQVQSGQVLLGTAQTRLPNQSDGARVETPYLQLVMTRIWDEERKANANLLRLATLTRLGGAEQIVRTHLDATMARMPNAERLAAAQAFRFLVTPSGTKVAYTAGDLASYAGVSSPQLSSVLLKLSSPDMRVLRAVAPPPGSSHEPRYEIFHDVLAAAILDWRERYLRQVRRRRFVMGGAAIAAVVLLLMAGLVSNAQQSASDAQSSRAQAQSAQTTVHDAVQFALTVAPSAAPTLNALLTRAASTPLPAPPSPTPTFSVIAGSLTPTHVPPIATVAPTDTPLPTATPTTTPTTIRSSIALAGVRVVFVSKREGSDHLYVMDVSGENQKRLQLDLPESVGEFQPDALDQRRIAFAAKIKVPFGEGGRTLELEHIFSASIVGTELRDVQQLTTGQSDNWSPAWAPGGNRLAFITSRNNVRQIYMINPFGDNPIAVITDNDLDGKDTLTWSPDNKRIIYSSRHGGSSGERYLFSVEVDTKIVRPLTSGHVADFHPSWSTDKCRRNKIVFVRKEDRRNSGTFDDKPANVMVMNGDGSGNAINLTNTNADENDPSLSPDGQWIVFKRFLSTTMSDIHSMSIDGTSIQHLTASPSEDYAPTWLWIDRAC